MDIYVSFSERVCTNCMYYNQYYVKSKKPRTDGLYALNQGKCTKADRKTTPLKRGCKEFKTPMQKLVEEQKTLDKGYIESYKNIDN